MSTGADDAAELLQQQKAVAEFGQRALNCDDLDELLREACRLVASGLGADFAKVLERSPEGGDLIIRNGIGWPDGVIGRCLRTGAGSAAGHALLTGEPVMSADIESETRFDVEPFLRRHGIRAIVNVIIVGADHGEPYGVLEVDNREPRTFAQDDIVFLRTYANLLAAAVERLRASVRLREALDDRNRLFETNQ